MTVAYWNSVRDMEALRREMERMFESFGNGSSTQRFRSAFLPGRAARAYPLMNIQESDDALTVVAVAPGLDTDTLSISVVRNTLRIEGAKASLSSDIKPEAFHRKERSAGSFVRTVELPVDVESDNVKAEYRDGILRITLPKAQQAKPKQVKVDVA
jgi:HSP20 family protein